MLRLENSLPCKQNAIASQIEFIMLSVPLSPAMHPIFKPRYHYA